MHWRTLSLASCSSLRRLLTASDGITLAADSALQKSLLAPHYSALTCHFGVDILSWVLLVLFFRAPKLFGEEESDARHHSSAGGVFSDGLADAGRARASPRTLRGRSRFGPLRNFVFERGAARFQRGRGPVALLPVRTSEASLQRSCRIGSILRHGAMGRGHVALPRFVEEQRYQRRQASS